MNREYFDDPVAAYTHLAPHYADLSSRRRRYLLGIEDALISRIPAGSSSLLDVGAGDGLRALRIARRCGIPNIVLLEPSAKMAAPAAGIAQVLSVRAEDLFDTANKFDVITCLWNVLGHVRGSENRGRTMKRICRLLTPEGICFVDVNHRYNVRSYGVLPTVARFIRDLISFKTENADVTATWTVASRTISTYGHVFIDPEVRQLVHEAGLQIAERIVVDYDSGKIRRFVFAGNLLYVLRRSSSIDSASAPHTS